MTNHLHALNRDNHLIHINDAQKGKEHSYTCPACGAPMIPKQGKKQAWHFAHKADKENCCAETYLYKVAKLRIKQCFEESSSFIIKPAQRVICNVEDCPVGRLKPCEWEKEGSPINLKENYDTCVIDAMSDKFHADLLIVSKSNENIPPILINISVSTTYCEPCAVTDYKKINLHISSEEDLLEIVGKATISETIKEPEQRNPYDNDNEEYEESELDEDISIPTIFYNFDDTPVFERPDEKHQAYKHSWWIKPNYGYQSDEPSVFYGSGRCLSSNISSIENSVFCIQARYKINRDFAFKILAQINIGIRYCPMCEFYEWNRCTENPPCPTYADKYEAQKCKFFKQKIDKTEEIPEYKVYINGKPR
ncbi:MAG: hypothetical protein K2M55_04055 [Muribaculaceae bacterium]|nr:hypothetical protein [Muribaculaceae bacterium]